MKTRHLLNVWRYLFLGSFAMCALLEKRPYHHHKQVWNGVSNNAPDSQNQTENAQIVPGPESTQTALDFDGQMSLESARCAATSTITQQPTATDVDCQPTSCVARASFVSIFYWPSETHDTACLATLPSHTKFKIPSGITPISPSVYAVVVSFTATDGCRQIGRAFDTYVASFAPDELSTVTWSPGKTHVNNFAYVPCGPPGWVPHGKPYKPRFMPPHALLDQMNGQPYQEACEFALWNDPSYTLMSIDGPINGPSLPDKAKLRRHKRTEVEARTDVAMGVHAAHHDPIDGLYPRQQEKAAAAAQGVPQPPAKTPGPN